MEWINKGLELAHAVAKIIAPGPTQAVTAAKDYVSEAVANRIKGEAQAQAYLMLAKFHRSVVWTIVIQNAVLMGSLIPVGALHSALPFYVAYAGVAAYSIYSVAKARTLIWCIVRCRSIRGAIASQVFDAIAEDLRSRSFVDQKAVEWLGPDLKKLSSEIADQIWPDIATAAVNMLLTLVTSFIAFRMLAIPALEHHLLG